MVRLSDINSEKSSFECETSGIISEMSCLNEKKAAEIGLVGFGGSAAAIGWISRLLLQLVGRRQTPRPAVKFGGKDTDLILLEEVMISSPPD